MIFQFADCESFSEDRSLPGPCPLNDASLVVVIVLRWSSLAPAPAIARGKGNTWENENHIFMVNL
jgi:hypothetical protein